MTVPSVVDVVAAIRNAVDELGKASMLALEARLEDAASDVSYYAGLVENVADRLDEAELRKQAHL